MRPLPPVIRRRAAADDGWVMVPVIALLAIGLALSFAALLLVDRQTQAAQQERVGDAAQTLAEGVATATAGVLASDESNAVWTTPMTSCTVVTGDLNGAPSGTSRTLESNVRTAVNAYFDANAASTDGLSDYVSRSGRSTAWRVQICPTDDSATITDARWDDATKLKLAATAALPTWPASTAKRTGQLGSQPTLWVRAQGDVRRTATGGGDPQSGARAVAAKVQRGATMWNPDTSLALATGSFDNDLGAVTGQVLGTLTSTLGQKVLGGVAGTKGLLGKRDDLITDDPSNRASDGKAAIGVRCGLLQGADDTVKGVLGNGINLQQLDLNLCLGGTFGGLNQLLGKTGLNTLTDPLLGTNRYRNLDNYSVAPARAAEAFKTEAQTGDVGGSGRLQGVYRSQIAGTTYSPSSPSSVSECNLPWNQIWGGTTRADGTRAQDGTVVYIDQIGNGDQACSIDPSRTVDVRAFVVNKGRIVIRGKVNGIVYALNGQECASAGAEGCTQRYRAQQPTREVIRVEGYRLADGSSTRVTGALWADGIRSKVGIYPGEQPTTLGGALGPLLSSVAAPIDNTLCSLPVLGPLVNGLTNLLGGLLSVVTGGTAEAHLPAGASGPPTGDASSQACGLVKAVVGGLGNLPGLSSLISANGGGGNVGYTYDRWQKCIPGVLNLFCAGQNMNWHKVGTGTDTATLPAGLLQDLLNSGPVANLQQLLNSLGGNTPTMLVRRTDYIRAAAVRVPDNAAIVGGSFRNVAPLAAG